MGLVYEVATQDVRSDLLFLSFVFCRHSREKYTMKLSDIFKKSICVYIPKPKLMEEFALLKVQCLILCGKNDLVTLATFNVL